MKSIHKIFVILLTIAILSLVIVNSKHKKKKRDGYLVLKSAEVAIELKHYDKVLEYLDIAKESDFGFCLNAHIDAHSYIDSLYSDVSFRLFE